MKEKTKSVIGGSTIALLIIGYLIRTAMVTQQRLDIQDERDKQMKQEINRSVKMMEKEMRLMQLRMPTTAARTRETTSASPD